MIDSARYRSIVRPQMLSEEIATEWCAERNHGVLATATSQYSRRRGWWRCGRGHEYETSIYTRVRTQGCKVCSRGVGIEKARLSKLRRGTSFSDARSDLIHEWNHAKNLPLTPESVSQKSHMLIWWRCIVGHEWQSTPQRRSRGDGCPTCSRAGQGQRTRAWKLKKGGKSFAESYPEILVEWDYARNKLLPTELSPKSNVRAAWNCKLGHRWEATVCNRTHNGSGCPFCGSQSSKLEIFLLCELRALLTDVRWRAKINGHECDITLPSLRVGVEVDGGFWHSRRLIHDTKKGVALSNEGWHLIRVRDESLPPLAGDVIRYSKSTPSIEIAVAVIQVLNEHHPNPALLDYIITKRQVAEVAYRKMLAHLPAPPVGESLADMFPAVASQWDYLANAPLTPWLFSSGSEQRVAWECKCGHRWFATIKNRTMRKSGCMACYRKSAGAGLRCALAAKHGSLAEKRPDLLRLWDYKKNAGHSPELLAVGSRLSVWWICAAGHDGYQRVVGLMTANGGECPECRPIRRRQLSQLAAVRRCGSLKKLQPRYLSEWDAVRNVLFGPEDVTPNSRRIAWWLCPLGHSYQQSIKGRASSHGCPTCYGNRRGAIAQRAAATRHGSLEDAGVHYLCEWDEKKNALKPSEVTAGSNVKVWWRCSQGHSYLQAVASKRRGCSCPKCANVVRAEAVRLARLVRTGNLKDQHPSIAELWHATKNHPLQPTDISSNSHRVVWWSCTAGHEWRQSANHLVIRSREIKSTQCCPVCLKRSRGRS